jgi:hypothetical protein
VLKPVRGPRIDQVRAILSDHLTDVKKEAAAKAERQKQLAAQASERGFTSIEEMQKADIEKNARLEKEAAELGFGSAALMARASEEEIAERKARKLGYRNVAEMNAAQARTART